MARRTYLTFAALVGMLALTATVLAIAFGNNGDSQSCGPNQVAKVSATNDGDHFTVDGDVPSGAVATGGGQRIEVNGHRATLTGPGHLRVECAK